MRPRWQAFPINEAIVERRDYTFSYFALEATETRASRMLR